MKSDLALRTYLQDRASFELTNAIAKVVDEAMILHPRDNPIDLADAVIDSLAENADALKASVAKRSAAIRSAMLP